MIGKDPYMKRLTAWVVCVLVGLMALDGYAQAPVAGTTVNVALLQRVQQSRLLSGIDEIRWDQASGAPGMLVGTNLLTVARTSVPLMQTAAGTQVPDYARGALNVMAGLSGIYGVSDAQTELVSRPAVEDADGYHHVVLNQRHGGIPVIGGTVVAHFDTDGRCRLLNGRFVADLALGTTPGITVAAAETAALAAAAGRGFAGGRPMAGTTLVVWARDGLRVLAYHVCVLYDHPNGGTGEWRYVVDANNGAVVLDYDNRHEIAAPGAVGDYQPISGEIMSGEGGGTQTVTGWADTATGASYLWNEEQTWGLYNLSKSPLWPDRDTYCHRFTNDWADTDVVSMSAAHNLSSTVDYFRSVHARNSFDANGVVARANIHAPVYYNAYWSPAEQQMFIGYMYNLSGKSGMGVMDVMAHEFTHAVTEHSANLIYQGESGALNESFSDIFGAMVEFYAQPDGRAAYTNKISGHSDWLMGEDLEEGTNSFTAIRDMRDPSRYGHPSRYYGMNWIDTSSWYDNGGVHINSGVQNHFFYLLCEGGIGTNETIAYDMLPLGFAGAEQVAYRTLTAYCTPSTGYPEAREAWLAAARQTDDAGITTNAWIPVTAAWAACGVGDAPPVIPNEPFVTGCRFPQIGPMTPSNKTYMVVNYTSRTQSWNVASSNGVDWLTIEPVSFTLQPMSYTSVVVSVVQSNALATSDGVYEEAIIFDCSDDNYDAVRNAYLRNGQNYQVRSTTFSWVDPIKRSHAMVYHHDLSEYQIYYDFGFFEVNYPKLYVSAKGVVGFLNEGVDSGPQSIPNPAVRNGITAPFWEQLRAVQGSGVYIGTEGILPDRYTVISWINMAAPDSDVARYSFQMLIREKPGIFGNNDIIFQYLDVNAAYDMLGYDQFATVGVEDHEGIIGREYSSTGSMWVADGQAILYTDYVPEDTAPPTGQIRVLSSSEATVTMEVAFNEVVQGLTNTDLTVSGNLTHTLTVEGSGPRYLIHFTNLGATGSLDVSVTAGAVQDLAGNANAVAIGPGRYAKALIDDNFVDDMEAGTANWETSEGDYFKFTQRGWEWGASALVGGSTCWGTVLNGYYYGSMNAYVQSRQITVGAQPILTYKVWERFPTYDYITPDNDFGYVEVFNGVGWHDVTPDGPYQWPRSHYWSTETIVLDPALFANRALRVRFRVESNGSTEDYGMYVDDVRLRSQRAAGLWVFSMVPSTVGPGTTVDLFFDLYNGTTGTCHSVTGEVSSAELGISFLNGTTVTYGDLAPGEIRTSSVLTVTLADALSILSNPIRLVHAARCAEGHLSTDYLNLSVSSPTAPASSVTLTAKTTQRVRDWTSRPLPGDGGDLSSYFQVISAGADGVVNLPGAGGGPTGDDRILYTKATSLPYGRFGVGPTTPPDQGQFEQIFNHTLSAGDVVYVRAWDGAGYSDSIAYGESGTFAVTTSVSQAIDFGAWTVGVPVDMTRDLNGDTVPDGYDILRGADARVPVGPIDAAWTSAGEAGELGSGSLQMLRPGRVAQGGSNYVFVADTENHRIQTWSADLDTLLSTYTGEGTANGTLNWPQGLDLDATSGRLVVADTKHDRVVLLTIDPATGALSYDSALTAAGLFDQPYDVAVTASGEILVLDTYNHRLVRLSATGVLLGIVGSEGSGEGFLRFPRGVCVGADDHIYVADTQNHRVQVFSPAGAPLSVLDGSNDTNGFEFASPGDVAFDIGGRMYVADSANHRVQVFSSNLVFLAAYKPPSGQMGSGPGQLRSPQGVWPSLDGYGVYVADTWNNRVQLLNITLDADGDGMSDPWEEANGLDSSDPSDADDDPDGDGLSNLGEYRIGSNPGASDSNGDGVNDGVSLLAAINPMVAFPPHESVAIAGAKTTAPGDVLAWEAKAGTRYRVEMSLDLPATRWVLQETVTASQSGVVSWTNSVPPEATIHFYRIRREL